MTTGRTARVSIGMPVYNGANQLPHAIEELLGQDFGDFELIISDNASTDGTLDICDSFARMDKRVQVFKQARNLGANANFDWVLAKAQGELLMWAAHDDGHHPSFIRRCVEALDESPQSILVTTDHAVSMENGASYVHQFKDEIASADAVERLRWIWRWGGTGAIYGLIRRDALSRTRPLSSFGAVPAPGVTPAQYVYELAIMGPFTRIEAPLFEYQMQRVDSLDDFSARLNPTARLRGCYLWWLLWDVWRMGGRHSLPLDLRRRLVVELLVSARKPGMLHELLLHYNRLSLRSAVTQHRWPRAATLRLERLALGREPISLSPNLT